jgi:hypothetical protein
MTKVALDQVWDSAGTIITMKSMIQGGQTGIANLSLRLNVRPSLMLNQIALDVCTNNSCVFTCGQISVIFCSNLY